MNYWGFCCFHCEKKLVIAHHGFCSVCYKQLMSDQYCGCCGMNLLENRLFCGYCLKNEPKWHKLVRVGQYQPPLNEWIHRFKFQQQYWLDKSLARLLLLAIKKAQREHWLMLPEVILPVPLFWHRHWQRGYNQAELLAKWLSLWLNIPLDNQSLVRQKATASQRELSANRRHKNLKGAFTFLPSKAYQRVAIVDDVVTTGSTLNSICLELLKQNITEIQVWVLGRA